MVRATDIQEKLLHLIGWEQNGAPDLRISDTLTASESGIYFQQIHPLLTLQNMACIAPDYKNIIFPEYNVNTAYKQGDVVLYDGKLYKARKDSQGVVPNLGHNLLIGGGNFELIEDSLPDNGENNTLTDTPESFVKVTSRNPHTGKIALHLTNNTKNNKHFRIVQWPNNDSLNGRPVRTDSIDTPFSNFSFASKFRIRAYAKSKNPGASFKLGGFTNYISYFSNMLDTGQNYMCYLENMGAIGAYDSSNRLNNGYNIYARAFFNRLRYDSYRAAAKEIIDTVLKNTLVRLPVKTHDVFLKEGCYMLYYPYKDNKSTVPATSTIITRISLTGTHRFIDKYYNGDTLDETKLIKDIETEICSYGPMRWIKVSNITVFFDEPYYEVNYGNDTYDYAEFTLTDSYEAYDMVYKSAIPKEENIVEGGAPIFIYSIGLSIIVPGNTDVYIDDCGIYEYVESSDGKEWKEYWAETNPFSEWLESKTKASIQKAISRFCNEKAVQGTYKTLCENRTLFDGTGRIVDAVKNKDNLVGFEIIPVRTKGVTTKINKIGLQFTEPGEYTLYLMHSSMDMPVETIKLTKTRKNSMEWFTLNDVYLPYQGSDNDAGGSWYLCYAQELLPKGSQAIRKNKDWSKGPCGSCSRNELIAWQAWSKYIEIHPFYVNGELTTFMDDKPYMWDVENNQYTYDNNYGINLEITVSCDITDFIIEQRALFQDIIANQVAVDMLREFAYNANVRTNRHSINASRPDILYEIDGDSSSMKKSGLSHQLDMALDAIKISTSGIDRICLPCKNNGIKYRTV